jgi:hypothetical protein
MFLKFVP